jgi:hypothetical protein
LEESLEEAVAELKEKRRTVDRLTDTVDQLIDRVTGMETVEERQESRVGRHTAARAEARGSPSPTSMRDSPTLGRQESRGSQRGFVDWRGDGKTKLDYTDSLFSQGRGRKYKSVHFAED